MPLKLAFSRRTAIWVGAGALCFAAPQKRIRTMALVAERDQKRLQAFYDTQTKYHPAPVPTPLDRAVAISFVNAHVSLATSPEKMRKLMRLAVFYDLRETSSAFASILVPGASDAIQIGRTAMALIAIAWIGDSAQQAGALQIFHQLQGQADPELHRHLMLEVVEAFGPKEGTGAHREWVESAIGKLEARLKQEQAANNIPGIKSTREKAKALTEYRNIQLVRVDRAFTIRRKVESVPAPDQIPMLVALCLMSAPESTPELSFWASMRLLRFDASLRHQIGAGFLAQARSPDLIRARGLRAAEYFGHPLPDPDRQWLASQEDTGTDPLVLRPDWYKV